MRENGQVTDTRPPARLTSDQVALVLRRAAELDAAADADTGSAVYDAAAIEEAASEVGLSPAAVRRAVAELRVGALAPEVAAPPRRARAAESRRISDQRLVDLTPAAARAAVDRFLRTQMFELRRRSGDRALYRLRSDLVASMRRRLDFAGAIKLDGLALVDVVVTAADDRTLVRVEAELTASRSSVVAGSAAAGAGVTLVTGLTGALLAEPGLVIAALPAGAVIGASGLRVAGGRWQRHRDDVAEVIAGLLDRL